ncbi:hypothetical protein Q4F19_04165 [Sphingomonas sp. BIUV-7]|uniref:C-type lysozyme inhibitor domain-containing protein n=1 Tax=Sphingomonas natans TaxID=3063330 RepID=A0ABT8Y5H1_9SPHN|nr:hypothetical protein [Sphingomonas sp. BIUV-7]MDO6413570.1 hypothetical protein [Sphingomonas sp. BIUV-7]
MVLKDCTIRAAFMGLAMSAAAPTFAYNLTKAILEPDKATYSTSKSVFDVERCLLGLDMAGSPVVYRSPDRPNESLYYRTTTAGAGGVVTLDRSGDTTYFHLKTKLPEGDRAKLASCQ